jgi:hypothetical protein
MKVGYGGRRRHLAPLVNLVESSATLTRKPEVARTVYNLCVLDLQCQSLPPS